MEPFEDDARLAELGFLARVARAGTMVVKPMLKNSPEREMVFHLMRHEYLNEAGSEPVKLSFDSTGQEPLPLAIDRERWRRMNQLLGGLPVSVRVGHKGRVRLASLRQELRTGWEKEKFGILWARRHVLAGTAVALTVTCEEAPLAIAVFAGNGLKAVNGAVGRRAGDALLRALFQSVATGAGLGCEAFWNGGDQVLALMPCTPEEAERTCRNILQDLARTPLVLDEGVELSLTAACGLVTTDRADDSPVELLDAADKAMGRAKTASRKSAKRRSAIVIGDGKPLFPEP